MLVRDAMTRRVERIGPDEPLVAAARRMREFGVGALVVCEGGREDGRVIGFITDRDIVVRAIAAGRDPAVANVRGSMTAYVVECADDEDLAEAAARMEERAVRRAVVFDLARQLVGMLSVDDIALHSQTLAGEIIEHARAPERPVHRGGWPWWEAPAR
jgi:CBS domain-containing protein